MVFARSARMALALALVSLLLAARPAERVLAAPAAQFASYQQAWLSASGQELDYLQGAAHGYSAPDFTPAILTIPDHPFTASRTYTAWRTMGNAESVYATTTVTIARDGRGRIHAERSTRPGEVSVVISDPVARVEYRYSAGGSQVEGCTQAAPSEATPNGTAAAAGTQPAEQASSDASASPDLGVKEYTSKDESEDLGVRQIEGVIAYGERTRHALGSERGARHVLQERWFAPELGLMMLEESAVEGVGSTRVLTHDVKLGEPEAALFQPPAGAVLPATLPACAGQF